MLRQIDTGVSVEVHLQYLRLFFLELSVQKVNFCQTFIRDSFVFQTILLEIQELLVVLPGQLRHVISDVVACTARLELRKKLI